MEENALENALKQIQTWFVNGEFAKVKQGCEEILQLSPDNSIAQDLLKKANEGLGAAEEPTFEPTPPPPDNQAPNLEATGRDETPEVAPEPETLEPIIPSEPTITPEAEPPLPETVISEEPTPTEPVAEEPAHPHSIIINVVILLVLVAFGIGGVYAYQAFFKNDDDLEVSLDETDEKPIEEVIEEEVLTEEEVVIDEELVEEEIVLEEEVAAEIKNDAETRNTQRLTDLSEVEEALIQYYENHKQYPSVEEILTVLIDEELLEELPSAPLENKAYVYAVYDTDLGPGQAYILSAEFENEDGSFSPWSTGENILTYTDYNDVTQENVTILTTDMTEEEYLTHAAEAEVEVEVEVEVETEVEEVETEERVRVPRS